MNEIWKDIEGFEEAYQVSNLGNIRSKNRVIVDKLNRRRHEKSQPIKLKKDRDGYVTFNAKYCGKNKMLKVHREVAKCFVDNPNNYPCIDHIDGVRNNNLYTNLRWCTAKQNANFELAKENRRRATLMSYIENDALRQIRAENFRKTKSKKVEVFFDGVSIGMFDSHLEASKALKISESSITSCIRGRMKSCKGYTFKEL